MFSTEDLRFFLLVVRRGSLAAAARDLNVTPPAVTQRLRQLEARVGMRLIDRSTRKMGMTDEGRLLLERAREVVESLDRVVEELQARRGVVAGELRIRASLGFGRRYIAPLVAQFHIMYPHVRISLMLNDRPNRTKGGELLVHDVVIHIGELSDSSQVAFPIAPNDRVLCAAPDYLRQFGEPRTPHDLVRHQCLVLRENEEDVTLWRFIKGRRTETVRVTSVLASNDGEVVHQWALAGKGVMLRSEWDVAENLRLKRLVRLLPGYRLPSADIVALVPGSKGLSARAKTFIEFVRKQFLPSPPWRQIAKG